MPSIEHVKDSMRAPWVAGDFLARRGAMVSGLDMTPRLLEDRSMRRWLLTTTLFALAMPSGGGADEPDSEKQVAALSDRHRLAAVKGDTKALEAVLADDWVVVGPTGEVDTKPQQEQKMKDGSLVFEAIDPKEVTVRMHGDTALVMGLYHIKATINGRKVDGVFRNTGVFAKQAGAWRGVFNQVTPVAPPAQRR